MMESTLCKEFNYKQLMDYWEAAALEGLDQLKIQDSPINADDFILQFIEETKNDESLFIKQCESPLIQGSDCDVEILEILESY